MEGSFTGTPSFYKLRFGSESSRLRVLRPSALIVGFEPV